MNAWWIAALVLAIATVAGDIPFHDPSHAYVWWHNVPGFDLIFGLLGCYAIVWLTKTIGKPLLQRSEGYYEGDLR